MMLRKPSKGTYGQSHTFTHNDATVKVEYSVGYGRKRVYGHHVINYTHLVYIYKAGKLISHHPIKQPRIAVYRDLAQQLGERTAPVTCPKCHRASWLANLTIDTHSKDSWKQYCTFWECESCHAILGLSQYDLEQANRVYYRTVKGYDTRSLGYVPNHGIGW